MNPLNQNVSKQRKKNYGKITEICVTHISCPANGVKTTFEMYNLKNQCVTAQFNSVFVSLKHIKKDQQQQK
jgi:hypothetical protein